MIKGSCGVLGCSGAPFATQPRRKKGSPGGPSTNSVSTAPGAAGYQRAAGNGQSRCPSQLRVVGSLHSRSAYPTLAARCGAALRHANPSARMAMASVTGASTDFMDSPNAPLSAWGLDWQPILDYRTGPIGVDLHLDPGRVVEGRPGNPFEQGKQNGFGDVDGFGVRFLGFETGVEGDVDDASITFEQRFDLPTEPPATNIRPEPLSHERVEQPLEMRTRQSRCSGNIVNPGRIPEVCLDVVKCLFDRLEWIHANSPRCANLAALCTSTFDRSCSRAGPVRNGCVRGTL